MKSNVVEKVKQDSSLATKEFRRKRKPKFTWIGGLKEFRDKYTSVELQEKVSDWIVESALGKLATKRKEPGEVLE